MLILVQFLGLIEDEQIAMLSTASVACPGQKLDPRTGFQNDLLTA